MNDPSMISNIAKAADIARSFTSEVMHNTQFILSALAASLFLSLAPQPFLPASVAAYRWLFACISVFIGSSFLILLWFSYRPVCELKRHCCELSTDEQELLSAYLKENKACGYFFAFHAPLCSLIAKGVLTFASGTFPVFDAPVMIQPAAMRYLRKRPHLVGLKLSDIGTQKPAGRLEASYLTEDLSQ
jgi:hypothetical protein